MSIDTYAPCPCGSNKKVKFCCSKDLLHELEKAFKMFDGDQDIAGLDFVKKVIETKGPRPAFLALKAGAELRLDDVPESAKSVAQLLDAMPHSIVGLALQSIVDVTQEDLGSAVEHLQEAFENTEESISQEMVSAVAVLSISMLRSGWIVAARAHMGIHAALTGDPGDEIQKQLIALLQSNRIPTVLKWELQLAERPQDAPWHGEFDAAMRTAQRGAWLAACESLESLDQKAPNQPAIVRNIGVFRSMLGQNAAAVSALRRYIALPGIDENEAIEIEAFCQVLVVEHGDQIELRRITYELKDIERATEILLSNKSVVVDSDGVSEVDEEGKPPPKLIFTAYDRPVPDAFDSLAVLDLPHDVTSAYVYGKETDRPARVELIVASVGREAAQNRIREILGEYIDASPRSDELLTTIPNTVITPRLYIPPTADMNVKKRWRRELEEETYLNRWPNHAAGTLGGKTPQAAVQTPEDRIRVLGAILNMELMNEAHQTAPSFDFNRLRESLGLPTRSSQIEVHGDDLKRLTIVRYSQLDLPKLTDDEVEFVFSNSLIRSMAYSAYRAGRELLARPTVEGRSKEPILIEMIRLSSDVDESLKLIEEGRQQSVKERRSPAKWHVLELQKRLSAGQGAEAERLMTLLMSRHRDEPGIVEALQQILAAYGLLDPRQMGAGPPGVEPKEEQRPGLWTPDSPAEKQESKLWLPGT